MLPGKENEVLRLPDTNTKCELSIHIDASCECVFNLFADLGKAAEITDAPKIKLATKQPVTSGAKWVTRYGLFGLKKMHYMFTVYDSPYRLVKQLSGTIDGTTEDIFEPEEDGTKVTRKFDMKRFGKTLPTHTNWAEWMGVWEKEQRKYLDKLKAHLEFSQT
jgi:hypothetical protein